jgi:hypothetical protein
MTRLQVTDYSSVTWRDVTAIHFAWKSLILAVRVRAFWEGV